MYKDLDSLLGEGLLQVPDDFDYRVMQSIKPLPMPFMQAVRRPAPGLQQSLQRFVVQLGVVGAGLLGLSQVVSFVFIAWMTSSAL